jgi:hypothetical protein
MAKKYSALYRKFEIYIPRNETGRPRSQFPHSVSLSNLYIPMIGPWQTEYINCSQIQNVEIGRQNIIILFWK